jgi:hypothetical protein
LLCHSAAKNAGNGLNTSFHATEDCGELKHGFLDPPFELQLEFFHPDRHIVHRFKSILDSIDLPLNELHDAFHIPRNQTNVATDGSHLDADRIDQFLCFMGCPANLEKDRDEKKRGLTP